MYEGFASSMVVLGVDERGGRYIKGTQKYGQA
jgi:hypothetical protein